MSERVYLKIYQTNAGYFGIYYGPKGELLEEKFEDVESFEKVQKEIGDQSPLDIYWKKFWKGHSKRVYKPRVKLVTKGVA